MMMKENVSNFLLTLSKYTTKRGKDIMVANELSSAISRLCDTESPQIFVNSTGNYNVPDVAVVQLYQKNYSSWLMDTDTRVMYPNGFAIEIADRCFKKYTDEELGAIIIHDMLHNVLSDTAKLRFIKAWTNIGNRRSSDYMLSLLKKPEMDALLYMAMVQICIRPFQVPVMDYDYVAADEVLKVIGLADAYDSYLSKSREVSSLTVDTYMDNVVEEDRKMLDLLMTTLMDDQGIGYIAYIKDTMPLLSLTPIFDRMVKEPGFIIQGTRHNGSRFGITLANGGLPISESYNNPKSDYDIRYSIDKIINAKRYAETEAERDVILFKIKNLSLRIIKLKSKVSDPERVTFLQNCIDELERIRKDLMSMEIKEKRWSVYIKGDMPEGYDM